MHFANKIYKMYGIYTVSGLNAIICARTSFFFLRFPLHFWNKLFQRWRWWISACTGSCLPLWYLWQRPILRSWHSYTLATAPRDEGKLADSTEYGAELSKGSFSYSIGWWRPPHIPQDVPHQWTALSGG